MRREIQKGCALLLGIFWAVTGAMQPLGMLAFAEDSEAVSSSAVTSATSVEELPVQPEEEMPENTESVPAEENEPESSPSDEQLGEMQENIAPAENPTVTPTPQPQEEQPAPTSGPQENSDSPTEEELEVPTFAQLKEQIEALLEKSRDMTQLSEEELGHIAEEMEQVAALPVTLTGDENQEIQELMEQLANAKAAVENMQLAYQAQREGWLDKMPQTGLENSWRYQNGERITAEEGEEDLPDGVNFFSAGGYRGIDVSHHQGVINWDAVKNAGIDFAVIRCGYGNDQTDQDDEQWERNVSECERLGIPYGVYFYSYALTADMAVSEGQHAVRLLRGHTPDLPVFYDLEENSQLVLGSSGLAEIARIFTDIVSAQGYEVGVYASLNWWNHYLTDPVFENWYRWVAEWRSSCSYGGRYEMWQYASDGSVNGISGRVDMDYWYGELPRKDWNGLYQNALGEWHYYSNGMVNTEFSGLVQYNGIWYYVKNGYLDWNYSSVVLHNGIWYCVQNGQINWSYTGLAQNENGIWYIQNGQVNFNQNDVTLIDGDWYYIQRGRYDPSYEGVVCHHGVWYCIRAGRIDWSYTGLAKNENGVWYIQNGQVNWDYSGLLKYNDRYWYVVEGKWQDNFTDIILIDGEWHYVYGGMWDTEYIGVICHYGVWYYIEDGILNWDYCGLARNENGLWYIENGQVSWQYSGLFHDDVGYWYIEDGKVIEDLSGLMQVGGNWYYFVNGCAKNDYKSVILYNGVWYCINNGILDWSYIGLAENENGVWYIENGQVNWAYTGLLETDTGTWYIKNGEVQKNFTDLLQYNGEWYYVVHGKKDEEYTGLVYYNTFWYYVKEGKLDWSYTGEIENESGRWFVQNGVVVKNLGS